MAFTGTPTVKKVSDRMYRITGVSLAGGASGTIGLNTNPSGPAGPGEIDLLTPEWQPYDDVTLQDAVSVLINPVAASTAGYPVSVVKSGSTHANFLITLASSTNGQGAATPGLEIYVEFH